MPVRQTTPPTDAKHEAEVAQQTLIESEVATAPASDPLPEVVAEEQTVTIKSVDVDEYPIHVEVVDGSYTFKSEADTFDVPLAVAEQFTYVSVVEVVA